MVKWTKQDALATKVIAGHLSGMGPKEVTRVVMLALEQWSVKREGPSEVEMRQALLELKDQIEMRIMSI